MCVCVVCLWLVLYCTCLRIYGDGLQVRRHLHIPCVYMSCCTTTTAAIIGLYVIPSIRIHTLFLYSCQPCVMDCTYPSYLPFFSLYLYPLSFIFPSTNTLLFSPLFPSYPITPASLTRCLWVGGSDAPSYPPLPTPPASPANVLHPQAKLGLVERARLTTNRRQGGRKLCVEEE